MSEWQPIETAPNDFDRPDFLVGCWVGNRWSQWIVDWSADWCGDFGNDGEKGDEPTHWMPLPAPPK